MLYLELLRNWIEKSETFPQPVKLIQSVCQRKKLNECDPCLAVVLMVSASSCKIVQHRSTTDICCPSLTPMWLCCCWLRRILDLSHRSMQPECCNVSHRLADFNQYLWNISHCQGNMLSTCSLKKLDYIN